MRLTGMREKSYGSSLRKCTVMGTCMMAWRNWNSRQIHRLFWTRTSNERTITCLQRIPQANKRTHNFSGNPLSNHCLGLPYTTLFYSTVREWTRSSVSYTSKVLQQNNHFLCSSASPKFCCLQTTTHRFRASSHTWKFYGKWSLYHILKFIINWTSLSSKWISVEVTCVCFHMCFSGLYVSLLIRC